MTTIASLVVEIGADISGLTRNLNQADRKVDNFIGGMGSRLQGIGRSLTGAGTQIALLTAPLAGAFGAGLKVASDFEGVMAEIGARAGLTSDELKTVSDFALQMGADTAFSGQQAAEAFLQLLTSGQNVEQAIATLPAVLDAAAASGEDLGHTADVITDIMAAFGLGVEDAGGVVESLARAAGSSSADMGDLGQGFANIGPVAKSFGLNVDRTAAILAVLSENGIKGAEAGSALKSMLLNMTRPTDNVQGAWADLGTSFYDTEGNARDLTDVLADIKVGLEGMPVEQQNELLYELGGSYGIVALQALLGANSIEEMEAAMAASTGASDVAAARMDTFAGRMDSLKGSVETLMIKALTPFMENILKPMAEQLTEVVNQVGAWVDENPELTQQLVGIAAAALVIGPGLVIAGLGIQAMGIAIGALGAAVALLTSPLFLAAAGLLAVGAGLAYIWTQDIGGVRTKIEEIVSAFRDVDISKYTDRFTNQVTGVFENIQNANIDTSGIEAWATTNMDAIVNTVIGVAGVVFGGPIGIAIGAARLVSTAIENDFLGIGTFLKDSGIQGSVETAFNDLKMSIDTILNGVFNPAQPIITRDMIERGVGGGSGGGVTSGPLGLLISDLQKGADWFSKELPKITGPITEGLSALFDGIGGFIENLQGTETGGLVRIVTVVGGVLGALLTKVAEIGAGLVGDVLTNIGAALPQIGSFISDFVTTLSRIGEGDWGGAAQKLADSVGHLVSAGLNLIGLDIDFASWGESLAGWVMAFQSAWAGIQYFADKIRISITSFFLDIQIAFAEWVGDFRQKILDVSGGALDIAPTVDLQLNTLREQRGGIDIAEQIQQELAADLTAGSIDLSPELAGAIAWNPAAIAAGMTMNGRQAVQDALTMALTTGDEAAYNVLLPLAAELGIDQASIAGQMQVAINAAAAMDYSATVNVAVTLNPSGAGFGALGASLGLPVFHDGGMMRGDGLALLKAGERVLNPAETQAYNGGGMGGSVTINGAQDVDSILSELQRRGINLYELARR